MRWKRQILLAGSAFAGSVLADTAYAEEARTDGPGEIIVTAQRRSESLQKVPIQVSALTAQKIDDAGIKSTSDAIAQVPNVTFDKGNNFRSSFITMRGLTQINNADPPIAFVVDGVPQTTSETIGVSLFDVERVEILKGPQGALYGRNAVGGAINVVTKEPTNDFQGFTNASYASGNTWDVAAGGSGALVQDALMFRVSGTYKHSDGLITNSFRNDKSDYIDHDYSLRGRLLFKNGGPLKIDLRGEYGNYEAGTNYYAAIFSGSANDFPQPQANLPGLAKGHSLDLTGKIDYDFGFATLTSITGRGHFTQKYRSDLDFRNPVASPGGFKGFGIQLGQGQNFDITTTSEEIRLVSAGNQPFRWLFGGYYLNTKRDLLTRGFIDFNSSLDQFDNLALALINKSEANRNNAYAAFAQVDYDFSDQLTLTGGLRYDSDHRQQTDLGSGLVRKATYDKLQPKVTLTWKPSDTGLLYATYSTGFRSGGFNAPGVAVTDYGAETHKNFEVGFKTQFLDRRLTFNGAAFLMDVNNYQFNFVDAVTASQINTVVPKVRIKGIELEMIAVPTKGLELSLAVATSDAEIRQSGTIAYIGNHTPRNVPFSATGALQYRTALSGNLEGMFRVDWHHYGKKYWELDNANVQKPYDIVNARIGVEIGDVGIYAFAQNLFDNHYYGEFVSSPFSGLDVAVGFPGAPRSFGVEAKVKF